MKVKNSEPEQDLFEVDDLKKVNKSSNTQVKRRTTSNNLASQIASNATTSRVTNSTLVNQGTVSKKKKLKLPIIGIILALVIVLVVVLIVVSKKGNKVENTGVAYEETGRYTLDLLQNAIINYSIEDISSLVNTSYLILEWDYANGNKNRQMFINSVCSYVKFEYPYTDSSNSVQSDMLNNENTKVTIVDYEKLAATMQEDKDLINKMVKNSKINEDDYTYKNKMTDLMLEYILSKGTLPTKTVEINIPLVAGTSTPVKDKDGNTVSTKISYKIDNDSVLDDVLFASDEFHAMEDTFAKVVTGWTGKKMETYMADDWIENPEYTKWHDELIQRMEADNGKYTKKSTWEPWFLRDENNQYVLDENGEKVVNYYTIKDENGNDVMQPDEKIMGKVEKQREVDDPFIPEQVIPYVWCGANYIQNVYDGKSNTIMQVGDGTFNRPAGIGTEIVTVVLGDDNLYHDVKVTLVGYWTGQDAIDYATSFSEKNRGFDNSSVVKLITYEIKVENLENDDITINSEMFLSDETSNQSARTGTMYGFYSNDIVIPAGKSVVINDWATSTELEQKYVCWGKSFGRAFKTVWFKVLAGNGGVVETYNATASTINKTTTQSN